MKAPSLFVVILVVFGSLVCEVFGSQWVKQVPENPNHPNQCHDEVTGVYHAVGTHWRRPSKCEGLSCRGGSKGVLIISGVSCPLENLFDEPSNCHLTPEKKGAAYPDCCPKMECDGPNGPV